MNLKAYQRSCADDDHGGDVVFARTVKDAKAFGSLDTCDCEFIHRRVRRAPEFDNLSPGPVTIRDYLARGWFLFCSGCGDAVYGDDGDFVIAVEDGVETLTCRRCIPVEAERMGETA